MDTLTGGTATYGVYVQSDPSYFGGGIQAPLSTPSSSSAIPEFRSKYYLNKAPRGRGAEVTVAVHVRRGDVTSDRYPDRFTSAETILRTITTLKSVLNTHAVSHNIRVYSQGSIGDFP